MKLEKFKRTEKVHAPSAPHLVISEVVVVWVRLRDDLGHVVTEMTLSEWSKMIGNPVTVSY